MRVGLVIGLGTVVAIDRHKSISDVVGSSAGTVRAVNRNLIVIRAESVTVGVGVVQKTSLEHLVV